jgi:hypothetical protein
MADWPDLDALKRALGITDGARDADLTLALDAAREQVQLDTAIATPTPSASMAQASLVLAVMVMKAPDAPYGIAGVFDQSAVRIAADHPTYQRLLVGQRARFPISRTA